MLYNMKSLVDCKINAIDGDIGKLDDFYFDDRTWAIRYLVVDTSNWTKGRQVLLSPVVIRKPDMSKKIIMVKLTKDQIKNSSDINTKKPGYRQNESEAYWPVYGMNVLTTSFLNQETIPEKSTSKEGQSDPHLRSSEEISGYNISAVNGEIGKVEDMIVDDEAWTIHYWVVKTKTWLPGKKVLISPHWINLISWEDNKVYVDMTIESIKNSPEYDPSKPIYLEYEEELNTYYGRAHEENRENY